MDMQILWRIRLVMLSTILLTVAVFGGLGYALDMYFGSSPGAMIVLILLSFPVSNLLAIRFSKQKFISPPKS